MRLKMNKNVRNSLTHYVSHTFVLKWQAARDSFLFIMHILLLYPHA